MILCQKRNKIFRILEMVIQWLNSYIVSYKMSFLFNLSHIAKAKIPESFVKA